MRYHRDRLRKINTAVQALADGYGRAQACSSAVKEAAAAARQQQTAAATARLEAERQATTQRRDSDVASAKFSDNLAEVEALKTMQASDALRRKTLAETASRADGYFGTLNFNFIMQNIAYGGTPAQPWSDLASWQPVAEGQPGAFRLGVLTETNPWYHMTGPAMPDLRCGPVLVKAGAESRDRATEAIQSVMLRLLALTPPGQLRFMLVDPVGLGQNVAPFMHLSDYDIQLVSGKAWTEQAHIEQQLSLLTEHMENVIQKYLRTDFPDIQAYNANAGEIAEAYRVLVVFDFPTNFSEAAAKRLVSIARNGPRCGVHALIHVDPAKPLPYGFNLADLEANASVIAWEGGRFVWQDQVFRGCQLELDRMPDTAFTSRVVQAVGEAARSANRVEAPFSRIAPRPDSWQTSTTAAGLRAPLGPSGARKTQYLELGSGTSQHVLVAGKTGSGKSRLLHCLITSLALTYSPEELELYLIDFKKGVEFKPYAAQRLPHARVIAVESEREFGISVLQGLDAELKRRGELFRSQRVDGLADYRVKTGELVSRILLVVDEFQEFFTQDDQLAATAKQILDRLVRQGRAFGIHVLLGSQTLSGAYSLAQSTMDQMAVRIALQCSDADSRLILAADNSAARLLTRPGEAIYNASNGSVEGNNLFQVAWLPDEERDGYLQQVAARATATGQRSRPLIVFEGNEPAEVQANAALAQLRAAPAAARLPRIWLGEPMAIADPTAVAFRRQPGSNLLVVSQDETAVLASLALSVAGLAWQTAPAAAEELPVLSLLDFSASDGGQGAYIERLAERFAAHVRLARRRRALEALAALADEVKRRVDADQVQAPPRFLLIHALQRARDLRVEDDLSYGYRDPTAAATPASQLAAILRDGPEVGVHVIAWCDTVTNLNRTFDRRIPRDFALRVASQMSLNDSDALIGSQLAGKLGPYRAYLCDEEDGLLVKFRPYGLPPDAWLNLPEAHAEGVGDVAE